MVSTPRHPTHYRWMRRRCDAAMRKKIAHFDRSVVVVVVVLAVVSFHSCCGDGRDHGDWSVTDASCVSCVEFRKLETGVYLDPNYA